MRYENLAVRKALRDHGVSLTELARHLGICQHTLSRKMAKEHNFEWQTKMILAVLATAQEKEDKRHGNQE